MARLRNIIATGAAATLAACVGTTEKHRTLAEPPVLVQATCAACHAIAPGTRSPIPEAPTFERIANLDGLTRETLIVFLGDTHNYPDIMDVDLSREDIELVADYMLTLRRDDYRRVPS
jgi:mono/diheme cytochrome c family protein